MFYKSAARIPMTFYGVTFNPGDVKEVPKAINNRNFIQVPKPADPLVIESTSKSDVKTASVPIKKKPGRPIKVKAAEPEIIAQLVPEPEAEVQKESMSEQKPEPESKPKLDEAAEPESAQETANNES